MSENKISDIDKKRIQQALSLLSEKDQTSLELMDNLFNTSDGTFEIIAPQILDTFSRTINTPKSKASLAQIINATNIDTEKFKEELQESLLNLSQIETLTTPKKNFVKQMLIILLNAIEETEGIEKRIIQIPFEKLSEDIKIPQYAHFGDSGMDIFALDDYTIMPGETKLIPTGIKLQIPAGYEVQIRPKSGRALKTKLRVANTPATIDSSFRGEIQVIIENIEPPIKDIAYELNDTGEIKITSILHGVPYYIQKGEKFAQLVLMSVPKANLIQVEKINETDRNEGGFGSTGLK